MIYIILYAALIIFLCTKVTKKRKEKSVQENWNDYFKKHPNTSIYYQPRRPQYRDENNLNNANTGMPWKFVIFVAIALIIISKLA